MRPVKRGGTARFQASGPPGRKPSALKLLLLVGGAGGAVILLIVLLLAGGGEPDTPPEPPPESVPVPVAKTPPDPKPGPTPPAPPDDRPPPPEPKPDPRAEANLALAALQQEARALLAREEFRKAVELWEEAEGRFDTPFWKEAVASALEEIPATAEKRFDEIVKEEDREGLKALVERVKRWGLPEYPGRLERLINPPLSPAVKAYRSAWAKAMELAAARNLEGAVAAVRRAAGEDAEVKAEASADVELLELVGSLPASVPVEAGRQITLRTAEGETAGRVVKADDQRIELETEEGTRFVEWLDLTAASRAGLLGKVEPKALAALCLLEGDVASAERFGTGGIPDKYLAWAEEVDGPPARPRAELEARDLFHAAELGWRDLATWGEAIPRYRRLHEDFPLTAVVRRNVDLVLARMNAGREYVFFPHQLKRKGLFALEEQDEVPWILTPSEDVPEYRFPSTYVEIEFYALPETGYRAWAYIGACCKETFTFYYQTTEGTGRNPDRRSEKVSVDVGGDNFLPVPHRVRYLKRTHEDHGGKKRPERWEWIPLPIPEEYAAPGRKVVRLHTDHAGFSVGYVVVSSERRRPPDEKETAALAGKLREMEVVRPLEITGLKIASGRKYRWIVPKEGDKTYFDRDYTFTSIPPPLRGVQALKAFNDDKKAAGDPLVAFTVNREVMVYVAVDDRANKVGGWIGSFSKAGERMGMSERGFSLWVKRFPAGRVELGRNSTADSNNMYIVFVKPVD